MLKLPLLFAIGVGVLPATLRTWEHLVQGRHSDNLWWIAILLRELLLGMVIYVIVQFFIGGYIIMGSWIDSARGSQSSSLRALDRQGYSPLASMLVNLCIAYFFISFGYRPFLQAMVNSYKYFPVGSTMSTKHLVDISELLINWSGQAISIGATAAAPIVLTLLFGDIMFGVLNRFIPQMNIFFLSMPFKAAVGLFMLAITIPFAVASVPRGIDMMLSQIQSIFALR